MNLLALHGQIRIVRNLNLKIKWDTSNFHCLILDDSYEWEQEL